jgi:hypothetical protein
MEKSLDRLLADMAAEVEGNHFILADAKDADMAFGLAAPGLAVEGRHPSLASFQDHIRAIVKQGLVDIVIMSASTNEQLALTERIFDGTTVTPAARANDTTDIWSARHGVYNSEAARPFRTATLDHIQCGKLECTAEERAAGTDLGLFSVTLNNDVDHDVAMLQSFRDFRLEAEAKGFRYFLEVFAPNAAGVVPDDGVGDFLNDHIARMLGGVTNAGRPLFLKIPYCGARALEDLVSYDPDLVVGILGGASGTTLDAFTLLAQAQRHGGRAALFGRKINNAEDQLAFIALLRRIVDQDIEAEEAVRAYHAGLEEKGIAPRRTLEDDLILTEPALLND